MIWHSFFKCTDVGRIILSLYSNDIIILSDDDDSISALKVELAKQFEMNDSGFSTTFLQY